MKTEPTAPWSLERRLRRRLVGALAALWIAFAGAMLWLQQHEMNEVLDSALEETAQRLLALPAAADGVAPAQHQETVQMQLFDRELRLLWRSHEAPLNPITDPRRSGTRTEQDWRVSVQHAADGSRIAVAAEDLVERRELLWGVARSFAVALLALVLISGLIVALVLRSGFRTLNPLRRSLAQRNGNEPMPLPLEPLPEELQPLARTIDELLARVRQLLLAERQFASQSAHELRTPLAAAQAQAQRLVHELPPGETRERASALQRQLERLSRLAAKLLQLSRVEAGVALAREPVSLVQLVSLVADEFRHEPRLTVTPRRGDVVVRGDIDALGFALRNLIDNALRHAGPQANVTVAVHDDARITVEDDGPGVPPGLLPKVVQPFERHATHADGSGLGLPIAKKVAQQSGGSLLLESPVHDGRGFRATLALPRLAESAAN